MENRGKIIIITVPLVIKIWKNRYLYGFFKKIIKTIDFFKKTKYNLLINFLLSSE